MANAVTQANSTTATIQAASANDMTLGDMRRKYDNGAGLFDLSFPSDGKISVREVVAAGGFMDLVLDYYQLSDEDSTAVVEMLSADANTRLVTASIRKNTFMLRDLSHSNKKINKKLRDIATYANGLTVELRLLHEMKQPGGGDPEKIAALEAEAQRPFLAYTDTDRTDAQRPEPTMTLLEFTNKYDKPGSWFFRVRDGEISPKEIRRAVGSASRLILDLASLPSADHERAWEMLTDAAKEKVTEARDHYTQLLDYGHLNSSPRLNINPSTAPATMAALAQP